VKLSFLARKTKQLWAGKWYGKEELSFFFELYIASLFLRMSSVFTHFPSKIVIQEKRLLLDIHHFLAGKYICRVWMRKDSSLKNELIPE
jgi:hypothetical protein